MSIIHISIRDWEIGKNFYTEEAILGNVKTTLSALNKIIEMDIKKSYIQRSNNRLN